MRMMAGVLVLAALGAGLWALQGGSFTASPAIGQAPATQPTQDQVVNRIERRLAALTSSLTAAEAAEKGPILAEIGQLRDLLADPARALSEAGDRQSRLSTLADLYAGAPAAAPIGAAQQALGSGDTAAAEAALAEARILAEAEVARAARLAFVQGDLATARGARVEAARAYVRAAALEPSYPHLLAAVRGAGQAGDTALAQNFVMPLLQSAVTTFGQGSAPHGEALSLAGQTLLAAGRTPDAEKLLREAVAQSRGPQGARDAAYAQRLNNLATVLRATGRLAEAEPLFREAVAVDAEVLGERHPDVAARLVNLADLLAATDRGAEAEDLIRRAIGIGDAVDPAGAASVTRRVALANLLSASGQAEAAGQALAEALPHARAAWPDGHPARAGEFSALASRMEAAGLTAEAEALYREVVDILAPAEGPDHGRALNNLGQFLARAGRAGEARDALTAARDALVAALGADHAEVKQVEANLAAVDG